MAKPAPQKKTMGQRAKARNAQASRQQQRRKRGSFKDYIKGVKLELKKVVWPTSKELGSYTIVVVATCAFFALAFWAIDSGFLALLKAILHIEL